MKDRIVDEAAAIARFSPQSTPGLTVRIMSDRRNLDGDHRSTDFGYRKKENVLMPSPTLAWSLFGVATSTFCWFVLVHVLGL